MNTEKYSLPAINGLLSFPTQEIMQYGLEYSLLESPGLPMHIMLGRMTVDALAKKLPENVEFDIDIARSLTTFYHATRQAADYGKLGIHPNPKVNTFMQLHGDMEYALMQARENGLNSSVLQGIQHYIINPNYRESGYFPHDTLSKDGKINWTESIPMLTSWLIAGVVTNTHKRFDDLRTRRSAEIGKLELSYWKIKIEEGKEISLPRPIIEIAIKEGTYNNERDIIKGIQTSKITNDIMGRWILDGYEEWANWIISEYSRLVGVDDFYVFLQKEMDTIGDAEPEKKAKIKHEFELMLGRSLDLGEFIPYVDGIELLFRRMRGLKTKETQNKYKVRVARLMSQIDRVLVYLKK